MKCRTQLMKCRTYALVGVVLSATILPGCTEPNPGPPGATKASADGHNSVQFPFGAPKNLKTSPAKGASAKGVDTSKFPPK